MSIEIQGAEELLIKFSKMKDDAAIQKGMQQACALVEASAKEKAPADTGALRRSIASRIEGGGAAIQGIIYAPLEYAPYVEYGTDKMAAKPYIASAKIKVQREIENGYVAKKIRQELIKAGKI